MDAFGEAVGVIFADPNFGKAAVYLPPGGGPGVPVTMLLREPDATFDQGGGAAVGATASGEIRVADLPDPPARRGTVTMVDGGAVYHVASARLRDDDRSLWLVQFGPAP